MLPFSFYGYCRDGDKQKKLIYDIRTKSPLGCQERCETTKNCVAFSFNRNVRRNCDLYEGGPYTYGWKFYGEKDKDLIKCYLMPQKGQH